ncbi:MAG: FKBP-type peptidyl-prolyl cis-trans isomerase [Cyclobacteriaceae bacterium]|jgi:FKBP-type peptidyl-prolyl cis-trans isomerase FkpA|nr:FKBP-type peptidyl-prolyl cis-trans isomerase [Cyclobacteriaceae bacterium]
MKKYISLISILSLACLFVTCLEVEDPNEQLNSQVASIDQHISVNYPNDIVYYDASGIRFVVRQFGNLPPAREGQNLQVDIIGKVFGETIPFQDELITTKLENVSVQGLRFVLTNNMVGSKVIAFVPSQYAFGEQGNSNVPPNAIIQYDLILLQNELTTAQVNQLATDTVAIRNYINANEIANVKRHPSGLYYKIDNAGSGNTPNVFNTINFTYTGKLMSNGTVFDDGRLSSFLFNLIDGFKIGVPLVKPGGKITLYVPSYLGYGTTSSGSIPANAVLIFDVDLNSILN